MCIRPSARAHTHQGWRHGYYFKMGDAGLGYYLDVGAAQAEKIAAAYKSGADPSTVPPGPSNPPPPSASSGGPKLKVDLFDWITKRLLDSFSGRYIIDREDVKVQVTSLWPHGHCGVADVPDDDSKAAAAAAGGEEEGEHIAVACDLGLSLEWRGTVYLPGSSSVLGSISGKVKVSSIRLNPDGRVTCEPELLLAGEKSKEEKAREEKEAAERETDQATAAAAALSMNENPVVDQGGGGGGGDGGEEREPEIVPLESAAGKSMGERVRDAMKDGGVHHVCEVVAQAIAAMVAHASGGEAPQVEMAGAPTGGGSGGKEEAKKVKDSDLPASTLEKLRPKALDKVVEELGRGGKPREGEGEGEGAVAGGDSEGADAAPPAVVSLAHVQLRETHFLGDLLPAIAGCKHAEGPKVLDLSSTDLTDAGVQQLVATLATGAVPALIELRLKDNDKLTSVSEMMLKGLGMMRKGVTVVR